MALRIAVIAHTYYEWDPRVRRQAEAFAARGDQVSVWCLQDEGAAADEDTDGVAVHRIPFPGYQGRRWGRYAQSYARFFGSAGARLLAAHAHERFDVVHVHTMPDFLVFAALLPRLSGAKVVLDMHDLMPDRYAMKFGRPRDGLAVRAIKSIQHAATAFADSVICVNEQQYELLLRDGVPARKLGIVMNGADPKRFYPRKKEPRIKDQIRIVYHGHVMYRYGVDLAVRALAKARDSDPRLVMRVLGVGDLLPAVHKLANELGLSGDVLRFSDRRVPVDEVAQEVRGAHLGVAPDRDDVEESVLPTRLVELTAVGVPTIAARTRCVTRYFDDSQLELVDVEDVAQLADAMVRLAGDTARRKSLAKAGLAWHEIYGHEAQKRLLYRTMDALCFEKVAAARREKQKSVQGVKTGKRRQAEASKKGGGKGGPNEAKGTGKKAPKPDGATPADKPARGETAAEAPSA